MTKAEKNAAGELPVRERLILAGIAEIEKMGIAGFSLRGVARACGVSCAAPYKHFEDKSDFVMEIIRYINGQWYARQEQIVLRFPDDTRRKLTEISLEYIRFLLENPHFRSIIMLKDAGLDEAQIRTKAQMSECTRRLIRQYCREAGLTPEAELRKTYVIRSLIYGAALMMDNGEMPYNKENMERVKAAIAREFDLP